jgi:hypothetical protein
MPDQSCVILGCGRLGTEVSNACPLRSTVASDWCLYEKADCLMLLGEE